MPEIHILPSVVSGKNGSAVIISMTLLSGLLKIISLQWGQKDTNPSILSKKASQYILIVLGFVNQE